jgi:hypothetical protein
MFKQIFGKKQVNSTPFQQSANSLSAEPLVKLQHLSLEQMFAEMRNMVSDPSKALLPAKEIQIRTESYADGLKTCLDNLNRNIGKPINGNEDDCLVAIPLLPQMTWDGTFGEFLTQICDFYPCHPMNTLVLPTSARASFALGLPLAKAENTDPNILDHFLAEIYGKLLQYINEVKPRVAKGELQALDEMPKHKKLASWRVIQLAHQMGEITYGKDAMLKHEQIFGSSLGWPENIMELLNSKF